MDNMPETAASVLEALAPLLLERRRLTVAIDGRCAAGKTTLAARLQEELACNVLHMDSFFLRPEQRTPERLAEPGGNVDYARFLTEALLPAKAGEPFSYRPYDCKTKTLADPVALPPRPVQIVEGAYSCHPALWRQYDFRIFLSVEPEEQLRRIRLRNGIEAAKRFRTVWIPLEERYFDAYRIAERCDFFCRT